MDFKKHLETALNLTLKFIVPLIIMTLVMFVVCMLTIGILAPVTLAGYMQSVLLMIREGREPKIQDLFSEMRLFFPLLGFGIVILILSMIGYMLFVLPGLIVTFAVSFSCAYMLPLMTDKGLGLIDAIKESYAMAIKQPVLDHVVVVILYIGIMAVGSSVFIGALFTQPFASIFLLSVYEERMNQTDIIETV
jgi:hypothetical protein